MLLKLRFHKIIPLRHSHAPGSYANVVNGASPGSYGSLLSTSPAMVLEDTCLVVRDLSKHVMGKVKDFTAIPRLYTISQDEEEMHSDSVGSKTVHNGGSVLGVMEDFIRIGQAMGYAMEGSVKDLATIIGQQGDGNVIR
ncbi:hypothetical protein Tco_0255692 [Tanacetum coccineum]